MEIALGVSALSYADESGAYLFLPGFSFGQPATAQLFGRNIRQVRLDIKNRCSVEHVDAADMQLGALALKQFDCG